ncbi:MAG: hypothetical protein IJX72_04620 [Clostridia bacterium]|nr:hypothetical protein [Clostridia bacterium]
MQKLHKLSALALAGLMGASLLLSSCNDGNTPSDTTPDTTAVGTAAETHPITQVSYTVTVLNHDGTPASDIIVKVQKNGTDEAFKLIGPTGTATFKLAEGEYTVLIESPSGKALYFDSDIAVLTPDTPEITLTVFEAVASTQPLNAPSKNGDYAMFDAASVGEGKTYVPFNSGDHTYVIFTPTRPGVYEFGYESEYSVELTYHGAPINVFDNPLMDTENGKVTFSIMDGSVGTTPDTTAQFVFRLNSADGAGSGCMFTATRLGDVPKSPYDEPWTVPTAPAEALKPYEGITDGKLVDLDVTNPALTVVLGEDGYYHLNTADGPVVFIRISSANPYMADFKTICDSTRICAYLYNEDGSFDKRISYNELIAEYLTVANEDGVVPMNEQLADMVKTAGDYMGWWNFSDNLDIFGDAIVDPAVAWLFACAVYQ